MMLKPLRPKSQDNRGQVADVKPIVAPTMGWYVGENLASPPPKTAYYLQNVFCQLDYIRVRGGSQSWATGMPSANVSTLMPYNSAANSKMFAACNNAIYDVSNTGAVGAASVTGLTGVNFQFTQFTGLGGSYLIAVNGIDGVQRFDGTGWNRQWVVTGTISNGSPNVSGLSSTSGLAAGQTVTGANIPTGTVIVSINTGAGTLVMSQNATAGATETLTIYQSPPITTTTGAVFSNVWTFKSRLYFVETNSLNIWYLGVEAIGGAATKFPMTGIFNKGGYIIACGDWAIDSTSGIYQGFCVITSEGEVAMYDGLDPTTWSLKGVYKVAKPLGPRCLMKAGGDLLVATDDGIVPMSKVEALDQVALENIAVTKPIAPAWRNAVISRQGLAGWELTSWPLQAMGIFNLPKQNVGDRTQLIVNTRTGAWSTYTGWDANCFAVYNNGLYYGTSDGRVMQAEVGGADDNTNYTAVIFQAFDSLNGSMNQKQVKLVRPHIQSNISFTPQIDIRVDYDTMVPLAPTAIASTGTGAQWDVARWDVDVWPATLVNTSNWVMATGLGSIVAPVLQWTLSSASVTPDVRLTQIDVLYEAGNLIG